MDAWGSRAQNAFRLYLEKETMKHRKSKTTLTVAINTSLSPGRSWCCGTPRSFFSSWSLFSPPVMKLCWICSPFDPLTLKTHHFQCLCWQWRQQLMQLGVLPGVMWLGEKCGLTHLVWRSLSMPPHLPDQCQVPQLSPMMMMTCIARSCLVSCLFFAAAAV